MNGIINSAYCTLVGKEIPMRIRIFLRILNAIIILILFKFTNVDYVIVYGLIIVISDIDAIATYLEQKAKKDCK